MVRRLLMASLMCCSAVWAQEWERMPSSFCSQIKAKGAKVGYRAFVIYEAPNGQSKCCEDLKVKSKGKTEEFGHFRVLDLDPGRYFLSFDLGTRRVNVPISVEWQVEKRYVPNDCEPTSKITVDKSTNEVKWEHWIEVD